MSVRSATAFAPASVANVAVGFDVLGFAIEGIGDRVTASLDPEGQGVIVSSISGVVRQLPTEPGRNTAAVAVAALLRDHPIGQGVRLELDKGIPLGSGMGGSAASAVAAVVAANALLDEPLPTGSLLPYAVAGEAVASGAAHADNVAPSLLGGLTAVVGMDPIEVVELPVPDDLMCVVVHPHLEVETRGARAVLPAEILLSRHVRQSMHLTGFVAGCYTGDRALMARSMVDLVGEPRRAGRIPGFAEAKAAAMDAGALALAISGSGPSVFAFVDGPGIGRRVADAIEAAFAERGLETDSWVGPIRIDGAVLV